MHNCPPPKKVTQRTSGRKRNKGDYSEYELTYDPPIPPKRKRMVDLERKLSARRIAAEKYKTKPANTPQLVRKPLSVRVPITMSGNTDTHPSAVASTSRTITTLAMQQETSSILKAFVSMDNLPDDDPNDYDDIKLPITPRAPPTQQAQPNIEGGPETDTKPPMLPLVIGTAIKIEKPTDMLP